MGWSPLSEAAKYGHKNICKLIMNNIEDKNPKDISWTTPLHEAARIGHVQVCKIIIDELSDIFSVPSNPKDSKGVFKTFESNISELRLSKLGIVSIVKY